MRLLAELNIINTGEDIWSDSFDSGSVPDPTVFTSAGFGGLVGPTGTFTVADGLATVAEGQVAIIIANGPNAYYPDTDKPYIIGMYIEPGGVASDTFAGAYEIGFGIKTEYSTAKQCGIASLAMQSNDGSYRGQVSIYSDLGILIQAQPFTSGATADSIAGWFQVYVNGTTCKCYWRGVQLCSFTISTPLTGKYVGFLVSALGAGQADGIIGEVKITTLTGGNNRKRETRIIRGSGGNIYYENDNGEFLWAPNTTTITTNHNILAVGRGEQLYIGDYGDICLESDSCVSASNGTTITDVSVADWTALGISIYDHVAVVENVTGNVATGVYRISSLDQGSMTLASSCGGAGTFSIRIERGPKVFDWATKTLSLLTPTTGAIPVGCPCIFRYQDRLGFAGPDGVWYMSRQGDWRDWNFAGDQDDLQRAVASTTSDMGQIGDNITAAIVHSDDYMIFGCENSIWLMRGDPVYGTQFGCLSSSVGVIDINSWCRGPSGETLILTKDGIYIIPPGGMGIPVPFSSQLPDRLKNIDRTKFDTALAFDLKRGGAHVFVTPSDETIRPDSNQHYWIDWGNKTYWPDAFAPDVEPNIVLYSHSTYSDNYGLLLGCRDCIIRAFDDTAHNDDGYPIDSYVVYGMINLGNGYFDGMLTEITGVLGELSGDAEWELFEGVTYEDAINSAPRASGLWHAGRNASQYPRCRGSAIAIKISGTDAGEAWFIEQITAVVATTGKTRML